MGEREGRSALIVVRRGAADRFAALRDSFVPDGVPVLWDRRVADRRVTPRAICPERRRCERRRQPPESWTLLDFVVAPGSA